MEMGRIIESSSRKRGSGIDKSESVPLTPSSKNDGSESTGHAGPPSSNVATGSRKVPVSKIRRSLTSTPQNWEHRWESYPRTSNDLPYTRSREYVRVRELSELEEQHRQKLNPKRYSGLQAWPKFFDKPEDVGRELMDGRVTTWSTFIIVETLLISIAIQPFITSIPNLNGWRFEVFGLLWMLVLVTDFWAVGVTCLFLGYLHAYPGKLTYMWVCNIGSWSDLPSFLVLFCTFVSMGAIAFSSWVIYGQMVGIVCVLVEGFTIIFLIAIAFYLDKACRAVEALESGVVYDRMHIIEH